MNGKECPPIHKISTLTHRKKKCDGMEEKFKLWLVVSVQVRYEIFKLDTGNCTEMKVTYKDKLNSF